MATVTFDTLKFVETLITAGVPEPHAKALAHAFREAQTESDLATKQDLAMLEARLMGEMRLLRWMLGVSVAGVLWLIVRPLILP